MANKIYLIIISVHAIQDAIDLFKRNRFLMIMDQKANDLMKVHVTLLTHLQVKWTHVLPTLNTTPQ